MATTMPVARPGQNHPYRVDVTAAISRPDRDASGRSIEKILISDRPLVPVLIGDSSGPYGAVQCGAWVASQAHVRGLEGGLGCSLFR